MQLIKLFIDIIFQWFIRLSHALFQKQKEVLRTHANVRHIKYRVIAEKITFVLYSKFLISNSSVFFTIYNAKDYVHIFLS